MPTARHHMRVIALVGLLVLAGTCGPTHALFSEITEYPTLEKLFEHIFLDALDDFRNDGFVRDIPPTIKVYFQHCLTQQVPPYHTFTTDPAVAEATSNGSQADVVVDSSPPTTAMRAVEGLASHPQAYVSLLQANYSRASDPSLPSPAAIFDAILRRAPNDTKVGNGVNGITLTWINFLLEDFLMTKPNAAGAEVADGVKGIFLGLVYGNNTQRSTLLRAGRDGKLRTSITTTGDEVALRWDDVSPALRPRRLAGDFVLGLDLFGRQHWGHIFWTTVFTRIHNWFCDLILADFALDLAIVQSDSEVFNRARMAVITLSYRTIFEDYLSQTVALDILRNRAMWRLNPERDCDGAFRNSEKHLIEFNHIYRWHNMPPDYFTYPGHGLVPLEEFIASELFTSYNLSSHFSGLYATMAGNFAPNNIHPLLANITKQTIATGRNLGLPSLNRFLEAYRMVPIPTFLDITGDADSAARLAQLYGDVDQVDLHVGLLLKHGKRGFSTELLVMLSAAVFTELYSSNHFCGIPTRYFSRDFLGPTLYNMTVTADRPFNEAMAHLFSLNLTDDSSLMTYFKETEPLVDMPGMYDVRWDNLRDYVGLNDLWLPILPDSVYFVSFLTALATAFTIILTFGTVARHTVLRIQGNQRSRAKKRSTKTMANLPVVSATATPPSKVCRADSREEKVKDAAAHKDKESAVVDDIDIIVFNVVTAVVYGTQMIPYCFGVLLTLFTSRFDLAAPAVWPYCITSLCIHMILYVCDMTIRFKYRKFNHFVFAHHLFYIGTVFVALLVKDIFSIKFVILMDASLTCEFGLYALMAYSKLHHRQLTPFWVRFGIASVLWFVLTRVGQTVILFRIFVVGFDRMEEYGHMGLYVFDLFMAILISGVQVYTVCEYAKWRTLWGWLKSPRSCVESKLEKQSGAAMCVNPVYAHQVASGQGCNVHLAIESVTCDSAIWGQSEDDMQEDQVTTKSRSFSASSDSGILVTPAAEASM